MSLPEISRRCLSCGAAVRAGGRFCPQCGKPMETAPSPAASGEVARADEGASPAGRTPDADASPAEGEAEEVRPAPVEEIRLEESWKRWEESVVAPPGAGEVETPARGQTRDDAGVGETRGVAGEVSAAPSTTPPPLMRPPSTTPAPGVVQREAHDEDGQGSKGAAPAATTRAAGSLARPQAGERGRRAAAVKESLRPRVERVRDASMGVLEEAAEDSGLRFVLIALVLFVVFVIFLLINNLVR